MTEEVQVKEGVKKDKCRVEAVEFDREKGSLTDFAMELQKKMNELIEAGYQINREPIDPEMLGRSGFFLFGVLVESMPIGIMELPQPLQALLAARMAASGGGEGHELSERAQQWLGLVLREVKEGTWSAAEKQVPELVMKHLKKLQPGDMEAFAAEYTQEAERHKGHSECSAGPTFLKIAEVLRANARAHLS